MTWDLASDAPASQVTMVSLTTSPQEAQRVKVSHHVCSSEHPKKAYCTTSPTNLSENSVIPGGNGLDSVFPQSTSHHPPPAFLQHSLLSVNKDASNREMLAYPPCLWSPVSLQ